MLAMEKGSSSLYSFCKATCMKAGPDIWLSFGEIYYHAILTVVAVPRRTAPKDTVLNIAVR
jgi:hypothetical protein